jgi:hypothetical protein
MLTKSKFMKLKKIDEFIREMTVYTQPSQLY